MFRLNIVLDCNIYDASDLFMAISAIMIKDKLLFLKKAKLKPSLYFVNNVVSICLLTNLFTPGFTYLP